MIILAQTDTTVGYLSYCYEDINKIKQRNISQKVLQTFPTFFSLRGTTRVPRKHRAFVRRSTKSTFILDKKKAFRVINKDCLHYNLLTKLGAIYSSSANKTGNNFDEEEAFLQADIIVKDKRGFFEDKPSKVYILSKNCKRKIR